MGIGDFIVSYQGRDDGFGAATSRATAGIRALGAEAGRAATGQLASLGRRLAAFATVGFLGSKIHEVIEFADNMERLSQVTGLSTDSIQELNYAAGQTSVSMEAIVSSIKLMERSRVEALRGNKELSASFQRIGISAKDLNTLSPDELFRKIARSIYESDYSSQLLSDSLKILGRSASQLFPIFEEGLDQLSAKARAAGVILGPELVKQLDDVGDQLTELSLRFKVAFAPIVSVLVPALRIVSAEIQRISVFMSSIGKVASIGFGTIRRSLFGTGSGAEGELERQRNASQELALRKKKAVDSAAAESAADLSDKAAAKMEENLKAVRENELKRLDVQQRLVKLRQEEAYWTQQMARATNELQRQEAFGKLLGVQRDILAADDAAKKPEKKSFTGGASSFSRSLDEWSKVGFFTAGAPSPLLKVNQDQLRELQKQVALLKGLPSNIAETL